MICHGSVRVSQPPTALGFDVKSKHTPKSRSNGVLPQWASEPALMTNTQSLSAATRQLFAGDSAFAFWLVGGTSVRVYHWSGSKGNPSVLVHTKLHSFIKWGVQKVWCPAPLCRSCFSLRSNEVLNFYGEKPTYFWYCNKNTIKQTTNNTKQNNSKRKQKQSQEERQTDRQTERQTQRDENKMKLFIRMFSLPPIVLPRPSLRSNQSFQGGGSAA